MSKIDVKKALNFGLIAFAAAALVLITPIAKADSDSNNDNGDRVHFSSNQPKLNRITEVKNNSVVLSFKDKKFKNETVKVIVSIKDRSNDMLVEKQLKAKLDDRGNGNVNVKALKAGRDYRFKVRIMRMGDNRSTQNSETRKVTTTNVRSSVNSNANNSSESNESSQ